VDAPCTVLEPRFLVSGRGLERTCQVVEHGQQLLHEPLVRALAQCGRITCAALAVVVELRREPLQPVEQFVSFSLESLDVEALLRLLCYLLVGHYAFGASCSSSMTS